MESASDSFDLGLGFDEACTAVDVELARMAPLSLHEETFTLADGTRVGSWIAVAFLPWRAWVSHTLHVRVRSTRKATQVLMHSVGAYGPFRLDYGGNRSLLKRLRKALGGAAT